MDYKLILGAIGLVLLSKVQDIYGQSSISGFNTTTTDKPAAEEDEGPPAAMIAGIVVGGLIVIWVVSMMCRDCYRKGQMKCFFDIICCVHCKDSISRCKKARVKPTKNNIKKKVPARISLKPTKTTGKKENISNNDIQAKTNETKKDETNKRRSSLKSLPQAKHKTVTFQNSRDLSPPRMMSLQTNVGSPPPKLSNQLPPIESIKTSDDKADNRSKTKNSQTTNEHPVVPNWDNLIKSSNDTGVSNLKGLHSLSDTPTESYNNSGFSVSNSSEDTSYKPTNSYEPATLNFDKDYDIPRTVFYVDSNLPEEHVDDPGPASYTPLPSVLDSISTEDDDMTDDSSSSVSVPEETHYAYPPPPDPPPLPRTFAKTPPPPSINVIIHDIPNTKSIPKAPPPSYNEALFYSSEPK